MGPGRDAMLGGAFLIKFDAFRSVAISTFLVCTLGSPEHDGWNSPVCFHATRDKKTDKT
jgi:hypothetical protein